MKKLLGIAVVILAGLAPVLSQAPAKPVEAKEFIFLLRPIPRLVGAKNWTEQDNRIVGEHFKQLQQLLKDGKLIMAGRTMVDDSLGVVIVKASSEEEARGLMESDAAVKAKIM